MTEEIKANASEAMPESPSPSPSPKPTNGLIDWEMKRQLMGRHGTDLAKNITDPMGDGDQRPIKVEADAQTHRDIWKTGADVYDLIRNDGLSPFLVACTQGKVKECQVMLAACLDQDAKSMLLETRYSLVRLSAIFFVAIGFAVVRPTMTGKEDNTGSNYIEVMRLLLREGARPDARDVCGKTIVSYCCGPLCQLGTTVLLEMASLCIARAAELRLPKLINTRDRFGAVPLQQAIILQRLDHVRFLSAEHWADPTIQDYDGMDPLTLASKISPASRDIMNAARSIADFRPTEKPTVCAQCHGSVMVTTRCDKCNQAAYCSRDCQLAHWKAGHKQQCSAVACEVPTAIVVKTATVAGAEAGVEGAEASKSRYWAGQPPKGLAVDTAFDIKVQVGAGAEEPLLLVHDKSRSLETSVSSATCLHHTELLAVVRKFAPGAGKKAYFRARVSSAGELHIATSPVFVRKW